MDAYIYQAALHCADCTVKIKQRIFRGEEGFAPPDPRDESSYDSDDFPKGPFADGGGEADTPQHCDSCGVFLENPLTAHGVEYVKEAFEVWRGNPAVMQEWREFYKDL
jgi:hypothetical protein